MKQSFLGKLLSEVIVVVVVILIFYFFALPKGGNNSNDVKKQFINTFYTSNVERYANLQKDTAVLLSSTVPKDNNSNVVQLDGKQFQAYIDGYKDIVEEKALGTLIANMYITNIDELAYKNNDEITVGKVDFKKETESDRIEQYRFVVSLKGKNAKYSNAEGVLTVENGLIRTFRETVRAKAE